MSDPSTRALGNAAAQAMAMQPEPVPMSRMSFTFEASTQGAKRCSMSSAIGDLGMSTRGSTLNGIPANQVWRSEEHTSELQSQSNLVCRLLLEKKNPL